MARPPKRAHCHAHNVVSAILDEVVSGAAFFPRQSKSVRFSKFVEVKLPHLRNIHWSAFWIEQTDASKANSSTKSLFEK